MNDARRLFRVTDHSACRAADVSLPSCAERIEERLADAESLLRGGVDIGDPHRFLANLWRQTHDACSPWRRAMVRHRLHAMARALGVAPHRPNDARAAFRQVA